MLVIIGKDTRLSTKANFIVRQLRSADSSSKIFHAFSIEGDKFRENWNHNQVQLSYSILGIITSNLLTLLRSPEELRSAVMKRLSFTKPTNLLVGKGFLSAIRRALYLHFASSVRDKNVINFLNNSKHSKFFLVDEFVSLKIIDLKKLHTLGSVIYISQDFAYNHFSFSENVVSRNLILRLERDAIINIDLIIACSEMEKYKYLELKARNVIFYPNIYPTMEFKPCDKDEFPSISIVLRDHWGVKASQSLEMIFNALALVNRPLKVYLIGSKPAMVPKNILLEHYEFLQKKSDYLSILSKSWIGINVGIHKAGTNERKYDYAEAGAVVFSDTLGARGDLLPHEYIYVDKHDLAAKINQILDFDKSALEEMGNKNRKYLLFIAETSRQKLLDSIRKIIKS